MTKGNQKLKAKIAKAVAARQAKREKERLSDERRRAREWRTREKRRKKKLEERRQHLKRRQGQTLTEAEVRWPTRAMNGSTVVQYRTVHYVRVKPFFSCTCKGRQGDAVALQCGYSRVTTG